MEKINFRLRKIIIDRLKKEAEQKGLNLSSYIRLIIMSYLNK